MRRGWSARKVGRYLGFHHTAVRKWVKKAEAIGYHPIATKSSRPKKHPKELPEELVRKIVEARLRIKRSSEVVQAVLAREGVAVSLSSVKRTLRRQGLLKRRSWWKWKQQPSRPFVAQPGALVEVDTIHLMVNRTERIYVFTLIDVYSRWAHAKAFSKCNTARARAFVKEAREAAPFAFDLLQSDHGSEFSRLFRQRVGIVHRHSRVRRPNDNAHLERFNRTIQEECLNQLPVSVRAINRALPKYLAYYNGERLHFGLNLKTPLEVVPSY